jgi:hypothetical protein
VWHEGDRYVGVVTAPGRSDEIVLSGLELFPA